MLIRAQAIRFFDITLALSKGTPPVLAPLLNEGALRPFLGLADDFVPILHDLIAALNTNIQIVKDRANATDEDLRHGSELSERIAAFSNEKTNIRSDILDWKPKSDVMDCLFYTAQAYRSAALIFLSRNIDQQRRCSKDVQGAVDAVLQACQLAISSDGPLLALLWPLFTAACEAKIRNQRDVAFNVFGALKSRLAFFNIFKAAEICSKIWADDDPDVPWPFVAMQHNLEIFFC